MAAALLFAQGYWEVRDVTGAAVVGAKLSAYITGTSTPANLWTDSGLSVAWDQPIETNAEGQSDGPIYVDGTPVLKLVGTDADDVDLPGYPVLEWAPYALDS